MCRVFPLIMQPPFICLENRVRGVDKLVTRREVRMCRLFCLFFVFSFYFVFAPSKGITQPPFVIFICPTVWIWSGDNFDAGSTITALFWLIVFASPIEGSHRTG